MFDKLTEVKARYDAINEKLMDPAVVSDQEQYKNLMKEYKNLTPLVEKFGEYTKAQNAFDEAKQMLDEGRPIGECAEYFGVSYVAMYTVIRRWWR